MEREPNCNVEEEIPSNLLLTVKQYSQSLVKKEIFDFIKAKYNQSKSPCDVNKEVYSMLRFGVNVQAEMEQNKQTT